jgi:hypothetical protein
VYPEVPPVTVTVAEPVVPPLHNTLLTAVEVARAETGSMIVTISVIVQPLASVTVTVFTPAVSPVITDVVAVVDHKYVYPEVPPDTVTVAEPVVPPLHNTLLTAVDVTKAVGSAIVTISVIVHPLASVTVTVFTPAVWPIITEVVAVVDHKYVYPEVPPVTVIVAEPVVPPLHNTLLTVVEVASAVTGSAIVSWWVIVQPLASVTVTVLTPAVCPVITEVVAVVDHK